MKLRKITLKYIAVTRYPKMSAFLEKLAPCQKKKKKKDQYSVNILRGEVDNRDDFSGSSLVVQWIRIHLPVLGILI